MKKITLILFSFCIIFCALNGANVYASSMTASLRGFSDNNLDYVIDCVSADLTIKGTEYEYGSTDLWTGIYKKTFTTTSGTTTIFVVLIDGSVSANGHTSTRNYFRNKSLEYSVKFVSNQDHYIVSYFPTASTGTNTSTSSYSVSGTAGSDGWSIGLSAVSSSSYSYDEINYVIYSNYTTNYSVSNFSILTQFTNYTDGEMISPNIGEVRTPAIIVYEIENYNDSNVSITIESEATIFRDQFLGSNYTDEGIITHTYSYAYGISNIQCELVSD